jgi:hypothetical protein
MERPFVGDRNLLDQVEGIADVLFGFWHERRHHGAILTSDPGGRDEQSSIGGAAGRPRPLAADASGAAAAT